MMPSRKTAPDDQWGTARDDPFGIPLDAALNDQPGVFNNNLIDPLDVPIDEHRVKLEIVIGFSTHDLLENKRGRLTAAQIARLEYDLRWQYWPVIGALSVITFLVGVSGTLMASANGMGFMTPVIVLMGLALYAAYQLRKKREQLPAYRLLAAPLRLGRMSLTMRRLNISDESSLARANFKLDDGTRLFAPRQIYGVLHANQDYRAFYIPLRTWGAARILSLEPIPGAKTKQKAKTGLKRKRW
ncbi:MAG: hypothetical protein JW966_00095 [Anaerolineae bacterium]|nr:hypothetical protein [Anaerolineae bacterium]